MPQNSKLKHQGKYVFHLIIAGVYFDDSESFSELLTPVLPNFGADSA